MAIFEILSQHFLMLKGKVVVEQSSTLHTLTTHADVKHYRQLATYMHTKVMLTGIIPGEGGVAAH